MLERWAMALMVIYLRVLVFLFGSEHEGLQAVMIAVSVRSHKSSKFSTSRVSLLVASHERTVRPTAVMFSSILICTLLDVAVFFLLWLLLSTNCFQVRNMLRNTGFPDPHFLQIGTAPLTSNTVCDAQLRQF